MAPQNSTISSVATAFSQIKNEYNSAKTGRFRRRRNVPTMGSGADYHLINESDYLRMIEYARDMDRNDAIPGQMLTRAVENIIQGGFELNPGTGDVDADKDLRDLWREWCADPDQCDITGEMTFGQMEFQVKRASSLDGDHFILPTQAGSIQRIESHRLRTPSNTTKNIIHGIALNSVRKPTEYWITKDDIQPYQALRLVGDVQVVPARDKQGNKQVFHIFDPLRCSQTRGIPVFSPIFDSLGMFEDLSFAHLVQAQIAACYAIIHEQDVLGGAVGSTAAGSTSQETLPNGMQRIVEEIVPGIHYHGAPGEHLTGFSPNIPNAEFFPHARLTLQIIAINLGLPLIVAMLDASEGNFSNYRAVVNQAQLGWRRQQNNFIAQFHTPVYLWKLRQWMRENAALRSLGNKVFRHKFDPPAWRYIDPLKDAEADSLKLKNNLTSPRRLHAEYGNSWDQISEEIVQDSMSAIRRAKKAAAEINKEFPDDTPITWRELLDLPTETDIAKQNGGSPNAQSKVAEPKPDTDADMESNDSQTGEEERPG